MTNPPRNRGRDKHCKEKTITPIKLLHLVKQEIHHKGTPAVHASFQVEEKQGWGDEVHGHSGTIQEPVPHRHHIQVLPNNGLILQTEAPLLRCVA